MHHADHDTILRIWRHHEQRRRDGLPTLSLHVGTESEWGSTLGVFEGAGRNVVRSHANEVGAITSDWLSAVGARHDVLDEAFVFVAQALGVSRGELRAAWAARSDSERLRWIEQRGAHGGSDLRAALETLRSALDADAVSALSLDTLMSWWPACTHVVWCVEAAEPAGLRALLGLAAEQPTWPLLASVSRQLWPGIRQALDGRSQAWLDSSMLPSPRAHEKPHSQHHEEALLLPPVGVRPVPAAIPPAEAAPLALQTRAAEALSESQRAHAGAAPERDLLEQRARSLAEQRLFELLSTDPLTRGLFELNRPLPFDFGARATEPDLVSLQLRLVLEVDGYYHFQELDAYRRDRRKDVLLQQHGYLVSRHLASDVVERAGEVLRVIRELVTQRRKNLCTENAS